VTEFETAFRQYYGDVYRFVYRLCGDGRLAEEMTQETFFKAFKKRQGFQEKCSIKTWLFQIAKNALYTYYRKNNRLEPIAEVQQTGEKPLAELLSDKDAAMRIHAALHALEEPYKEVFMLRIFGELPFAQIGLLFDKTENWARVTFYRSKQRIMREVGRES
jgi:RNA polymerase sigma-70 factor (ECF subfamily)